MSQSNYTGEKTNDHLIIKDSFINSDKYWYKDNPYETMYGFKTKDQAIEYAVRINEISEKICGFKFKWLINQGQLYTHRWCVLHDGCLDEDYYNKITKEKLELFSKLEKRLRKEINKKEGGLIPIKEKLCNCGTFDFAHLPNSFCGKFFKTDQSSYEELLENKDEYLENLKVIERRNLK